MQGAGSVLVAPGGAKELDRAPERDLVGNVEIRRVVARHMERRTVGDRCQAAPQCPSGLVLGVLCCDAQSLVEGVLVGCGQYSDVH